MRAKDCATLPAKSLIMKNLIASAFFLFVYSFALATPSIDAALKWKELKAGTMVRVSIPSLPNMMSAGQTVSGYCQSDVLVRGETFIQGGAPVTLRVVSFAAPKILGKPGSVTVEAVSVTAVDGTQVPLTGGTINAKGEDNETKSVLLGFFICFLFFFQKGGEAQIAPNTTLDAFVATSVDIDIE